MDVEQLQNSYRVFTMKKGHPKVFLFMSTTVVAGEGAEYSSEGIRSFLTESAEIGKAHAADFGRTMEALV